nr:AraC family transcriptional regulator [Gracilibacillus alcaliphilus]
MAKDNLVIYFEDIFTRQEQQKLWHPIDNQNKAKLIQSLKLGDQIVAKETLTTILSDLNKKDITVPIFKCLCFEIINTILENIPAETSKHAAEDVKAIVEFRSLDNLEANINRLIVKICDDIQQKKVSNNLILRDNILTYIHQRYKSHDLSIDESTEKFQLSPSYLSRFIKEQTGETFSQYVWNLRLDEFKRQLMETDLPIKTIVSNIGYIDIANFTRRFKKAEGLTPGQYRKYNAAQ